MDQAEQLEQRALLSAVNRCSAFATDGASTTSFDESDMMRMQGRAASKPSIAGNWLLTGEGQIGGFTNAVLGITQIRKKLAGNSQFAGGSFQFFGKIGADGHIKGKASLQFGQNSLTRQRFFADLNPNLQTFSGQVDLKQLDEVFTIEGERQV